MSSIAPNNVVCVVAPVAVVSRDGHENEVERVVLNPHGGIYYELFGCALANRVVSLHEPIQLFCGRSNIWQENRRILQLS